MKENDRHTPTQPSQGGEVAIDWEEVRQRVAAAGATLASMDESAPEMVEQVWARRAARLAQVEVEEDKGEKIEMVLIRLGREIYALDAVYVCDIRPAERITRVPRVPEWVSGVVNLRGRILSVLDLQRFLGLPLQKLEDDGLKDLYLVVVETPAMELAMLVDQVLAVQALPVADIQDSASTVRGIRSEYVRGVINYVPSTGAWGGQAEGQAVLPEDEKRG
jgi:purine-binding chemotaxis protein CheW